MDWLSLEATPEVPLGVVGARYPALERRLVSVVGWQVGCRRLLAVLIRYQGPCRTARRFPRHRSSLQQKHRTWRACAQGSGASCESHDILSVELHPLR